MAAVAVAVQQMPCLDIRVCHSGHGYVQYSSHAVTAVCVVLATSWTAACCHHRLCPSLFGLWFWACGMREHFLQKHGEFNVWRPCSRLHNLCQGFEGKLVFLLFVVEIDFCRLRKS